MLNEIFWGGENIALKCAWRHVDIVAKFIIEFHLSSHRTLDAAGCPDIPVHRWLISGCQKLWELTWAQNALKNFRQVFPNSQQMRFFAVSANLLQKFQKLIQITKYKQQKIGYKQTKKMFKTLPKAQQTRGLSSYHTILHKSWPNLVLKVWTTV